jgi:hypothetical protein
MCGINTVNTEIGIIVGKFDHDLALYTPLIATFVQMVAAYTSTAALAYFNRRTLILFGNFSLGIIDVLIGVLFLIVATTGWNQAIYIIIALIIIYMFVFGMTIGPIVWLYVP